MAESSFGRQGNPGLGVDAQGNPVVDPTQNVLNLVAAAIQRQDDLRAAESRHVREIAGLRAEYAMELRDAETQRINAIRQVDVEAVQRAAEVQATQATALAKQVTDAAEANRAAVAAAAAASSTALAAALEPIQKDIQELRKAQYEAAGVKAQTTDTTTSSRSNVLIGVAAAGVVVAVLSVVATVVIALLLSGTP
jgi:cobalamin biosynthesis Mg chelatase CobN